MELRYIIRDRRDDPVKVLQYRVKYKVTDYGNTSPTGDWLIGEVWSEWQDVPTVDLTVQRKNNG